MIDTVRMRNFKCFEDQSIQLAGLNVLAGLNGTGKSTVIQSLLLLRQTGLGKDGRPESLRWRGSLVDPGSFEDALHAGSEQDRIVLEAVFQSSGSVRIEVGGTGTGDAEMIDSTGFPGASRASLYRPSLFYLDAERLGPQKTLPFPDQEHESQLWEQVNAWLGGISPGAEVRMYGLPDDRTQAGFSFGLSYALPVIVALLSARTDDLVIVEHPEAHLHPAGQTRLAELAARAAAAGAQVILETHGDHILDGIRLAVRKAIIAPDQTTFHYFRRKDLSIEVETPVISENGRLDFWPDGFFDQHERNLAALVAPR